jgi:S-adenosylmethionine:tRNA ribosyltransferase-isomerase
VLLKDFDYELPRSAIALRPAAPRDTARLLTVAPQDGGLLTEARVRDLPAFLRRGDVMVFNNTKVLPAELSAIRPSRELNAPAVPVSLTLLEPLHGGAWRALARPARRLREGDILVLSDAGKETALTVKAKGPEGEVTVIAGGGLTIEAAMAKHGAMPLPPYVARARPSDDQDFSDYQTVYAQKAGAVAAPTAGLHFTPELMQRLEEAGIATVFVTLHTGPGTFLPVKEEKIENHHIHSERCEVSARAAEAIDKARQKGGRIIAVGTTSLRLLETAARDDGTIAPYRGSTSLFIKPGHCFRSAELLLTNFHLPKSTLFMLVCAFSGTALMKRAYAHAIAAGFRFYSYGDACLLYRAEGELP